MSSLMMLGLIFAGAVGALAVREHRVALAARQGFLGSCVPVLRDVELHCGGDGFPRLSGQLDGDPVHLELIPDTMVMRRLPQLWASLTLCKDLGDIPGFAVLVRPAGYEFYSLTAHYGEPLDAPAELPSEVLVRGSDASAEALLFQLAPSIGSILADPRVKEIAVTKRGLRLIWQVGEGRRGEHLLLRQVVFDNATVEAGELVRRLDQLGRLQIAIEGQGMRRAA